MNKSLATNLISVALVGIGYMIPTEHFLALPIRNIGLYATSGAITNWLAIYMLFEKIPGLYGSGVIPSRFEEFKRGIRHLIMDQFFTHTNVQGFFHSHASFQGIKIQADPILAIIDYDAMFQKLVQAILNSPYGGMLGMLGGAKALDPLRKPFEDNVRSEIEGLMQSPELAKALESSIRLEDQTDTIIQKVDAIVQKRLDELTPQMVKDIIQEMIREHLGWLVIWGGIFGGLLGLIAVFLPS